MRLIVKILTAISTLLISATHIHADTTISAAAFAQDVAVLEKTLKQLHPGIYRYQTKAEVDSAFKELANQTQELSLEEAYLKLSKFSAAFLCSHTHTNPWNQNQAIKDSTSEKADKLPFAWRFFEHEKQGFRLFVDYYDHGSQLAKGTEIVAINGMSINDLMNRLRAYVPADGVSPVKVKYQLSWQQGQKYQWFDILLPLLAPPKLTAKNRWQYTLTVLTENTAVDIQIPAVTAQEREKELAETFQFKSKTYDEMWEAEMITRGADKQNIAYLKMSTFATWKMSMDWKAYLDSQFQTFADAKADKLILDIRGNEGGMYEVAEYLYPYLIKQAVTINNFQQKVRYKVVPEDLRPFLKTWDQAIYDISSRVTEKSGDFWLLDSEAKQRFQPNGKHHFRQVILLTDGANSSATFIMSRALQQSGQVTLVGETLGGNAQGQTGGQLFFLKLPNSQVSIDVPLINFFDEHAQTTLLQPDILVSNSFDDWINDHDKILQTAIDM